jgi:hypothetical protein
MLILSPETYSLYYEVKSVPQFPEQEPLLKHVGAGLLLVAVVVSVESAFVLSVYW